MVSAEFSVIHAKVRRARQQLTTRSTIHVIAALQIVHYTIIRPPTGYVTALADYATMIMMMVMRQ